MPPKPSTFTLDSATGLQKSAISGQPSGIRIDHVAIGSPDAARARDQFWALLGGTIVWDDPIGSGTGFRGVMMRSGGSMLEIIEPMGSGSFVNRFLESRGPGIHHITYYLDDPDSIVERAVAEGRTITGIERKDGRITNAFFHPKSAHGIVIQLRPNRKYEPENEASRRHHEAATNNLPPSAPERWTVDRVVLVAPAIAPVLTFFQSYFGGAIELDVPGGLAGGREVVVRWTGLGVGIIEPTDPDGPVARFLAERGAGAHSLVLRRGRGSGVGGRGGETDSPSLPLTMERERASAFRRATSPVDESDLEAQPVKGDKPVAPTRNSELKTENSAQPSTEIQPSAFSLQPSLVEGTLLRFLDE